jgi:integrase
MFEAGIDPELPADLDDALCEYFHHLYITRAGKCRSYAEAALSGLSMFVPALRGKLSKSALAIRGWKRLVPSVQYPPMTYDVCVCLAVHMAVHKSWSLGVATLLAFECYLRIGELTNLTTEDVAVSGDRRMGSAYRGVSLRLKRTKTGKNQWVEVRSPAVRGLIVQLLIERKLCRRSKLFACTSDAYRRYFKASCAALGLSEDYVPHSLRHGGATHDHLMRRPLEEILRHGRWASMKSARHYVQAGRALLLASAVPTSIAEIAAVLVPNVVAIFNTLSQRH